MSVQIFTINSGTVTYKYGGTVGIATPTGLNLTNVKFDQRVLHNVSAVENKYSGTISYSGNIASQSFG